MTLYTEYRPTSFDEVVGNEDAIEGIQAVLEKDVHAFGLWGPSGCGKTTLGRIIAKELNCADADYMELDSADFRGIDTIRQIRRQVDFKPASGASRVWLLDECHQLSNDAQNALLKVLEEPPPWVYFILCTTTPQKLLPTIRSRCSEHIVSPLDEDDMRRLLRRVVKAEGKTLNKSIYSQIVQDSVGHPRAALTVLEQVIDLPPDRQKEVATKVAMEQSQVIELCRALVTSASWKKVRRLLNGLADQDAEAIRRQVLGYCQSILLNNDRPDPQVGIIMEAFMQPFYDTGRPQLVFACYASVVEV